jgi:hypothetical protein
MLLLLLEEEDDTVVVVVEVGGRFVEVKRRHWSMVLMGVAFMIMRLLYEMHYLFLKLSHTHFVDVLFCADATSAPTHTSRRRSSTSSTSSTSR